MDNLYKYIIDDEITTSISEFCKDRPSTELTGFNYRSVQSNMMKGDNNPMANPKVRETHRQVVKSKEYRKKLSEALMGHKKSNTENMKGPKSESHKSSMSRAALNRPRTTCDKCGQDYTKANFKKHYNSCKGYKQAQYKKCDDGIVRRVIL
jgi:hypothetical protein